MSNSAKRSGTSAGFLSKDSLSKSGIPILFLLFVFLLGGGSRSDIASLPLLRGGAVLFGCWAIMGMSSDDWRRIRVPLILLLVLTVWTAIQLVPLPPSLWHSLPARDVVQDIDRVLGQPDLWRAISLTPTETWNSLLAMSVPLAAVLLAGRLGPDDRRLVMLALVAIAFASALLGFAQIATGIGYLYRIANEGLMIGFFANRNHHAIFQACAALVAAMVLRDELMRRRQHKPLQIALAFAALLSVAMTVLIGSRAGFAAGAIAFTAGYAMLVPVIQGRRAARQPVRGQRPRHFRWLVYMLPVVLVGLLFAAAFMTERSTALSRVAGGNVADDLRFLAWPTVATMMETFWVFGSGFGSFPDTYAIFETDALLFPSYFNHAHNDWAEAVITGGLPFVLVILGAFVWLFRAGRRRGIKNIVKGHRGDDRLTVLAVTTIVTIASFFDYPLRVPSLQAMMIFLLVLFACLAPATAQRE